ncbi:hypothetical protein RJ639_016454, partial [Escallonia herrerae]
SLRSKTHNNGGGVKQARRRAMESTRILQWHRWHGTTSTLQTPLLIPSICNALRPFFLLLRRYSIMKAGVNATTVEAFDINDTANDVYQHNFGYRPFQGNIQTLSAALSTAMALMYGFFLHLANHILDKVIESFFSHGIQKDSNDARASSFLKILELIPQTSQPPLMLFVENVVGFETSDTHRRMAKILEKAGIYFKPPLHFWCAIFEVAVYVPRTSTKSIKENKEKRKPLYFQNPLLNQQLVQAPGPLIIWAQ